MIEPEVRRSVEALLAAVRTRPTVLPLAELHALAHCGFDVGVDRSLDETVVYVTTRADPRFEPLSPREREVATLAAAGMSNDQISAALFVTVATVKDHMHSIFTKTGFASRAQMIAAWYGGLDR